MAGSDDEEDNFPATQSVMSVLLSGVTAYVEVRSGHDNRSKGVKAHMRSLGAKIEETLNKKVTHVVFNEGLPSTYKKAKKFKCHLVSVLWIEACKEALSKVSEAGYPPIGQQVYENPDSLKNFKKLKSMQPDSDEEAVALKTKKMLKRIARSRRKNNPIPDATKESDKDDTEKKIEPKAINKRKRSKAAPKKTALQEITPDVVNKGATCAALVTQPTEATAQDVEPVGIVDASALRQDEAGQLKKKPIKSRKASDDAPITRRDFIECLNDICISVPNESPLGQGDISPWRKGGGPPPVKIRRKNPTAKRVSPRRSPRNASDSSDGFLFPAIPARRSPRQVSGIVKNSKNVPAKKPSVCTSASAALMRNKKPAPPPSPGDDFLLLSQEPGDMPSIDEMAKLQRGSIRAGDERITLSQIIKSYNAVAEEHSKSSASTPGSSSQVSEGFVRKGCPSQRALDDTIAVDVEGDMACDTEVRNCASRCSSETGSTVSSTSTRVLINGKPPSEVGCSSNYLPSSGEIGDQHSEIVNIPEELEREPSPIFVIKKAKFRKPLKKKVNETKQSGTEKKVESSDIKLKGGPTSSEDKRQSINPLDYINKILLPKFVDKTPANVHMGNVIVEETPEVGSVSNCVPDSRIIPPTPIENQVVVASQNQSLTSSVLSWVKKSCKVPLFSSHSKKGVVQPTIESKKENSSKGESNDPLSQGSIYYSFSKENDAPAESENPTNDLVPSVNSQVSSKSSHSTDKKTEEQSTRKSTRKKNVTNLGKNEDSSPVAQIQKAQEAHCSSGYETSNSLTSNTDPEENQFNKNASRGAAKPKKITDLLSPITGPTKKRSDIFENSPASASPATDRSIDTTNPQRQCGRKRIQSLPDKESKKAKLNNSESDCSSASRRTRASRVDASNVLTESRSDLSSDSIKSSGRKSSEEARKRMAVSLTRNYKSHAIKVIVCTFLTASEQNGIDSAGTKLGGWKLEEKVTSRTTHVINSGPKRTLNMLKGMARGCWLVDQQWMLDSAKAGTWLEEDKYELTKFSPAVRLCRMKRQAIGKDYKHNLFSKCGTIYVSPKINGPPAKDIRELLELCGADLKTSTQEAKIIVGDESSHKGSFNCVEPRWVLDSITQNKVLPMK